MNNKKNNKNEKMTIDKLAIIMNNSFEILRRDIGEVKRDIKKIEDDIKDIHKDILNLGDRFVSYHAFDSLSHRVKILEDKKK